MNEEKPESIWKKSWTGGRLLLFWILIVSIAAFLFAVLLAIFTSVKTTFFDKHSGLENFVGYVLIVWFWFLMAVALVLVSYGIVRWLFRWRNLNRTLFGFACLATLIALFYAEENWRGKHDWEKYKRAEEAKGEKLDFKNFVPPPVPDDQNFAMQPIWIESIKATLGPKRSPQWFGANYAENGRTNFVDWLGPLNVYFDGTAVKPQSVMPELGNWQKNELTDLTRWQIYYREDGLTNRKTATYPAYYPPDKIFTFVFPVAPQPQTPAQDVLLALSKYDSVIEELRDASKLPDSRFPLNYDIDDPAEILLPHLAALKRSSEVLQLRAIAELQNGESEKAFDDIKLNLRLANSVRTEPFIITHLVRIAILNLALQPIYEGLAEHKWSDAQLAELDSKLSKLDFLADYELSVSGERAAHIKIVDWIEQKPSRFWDLFNIVTDDEKKIMNNFFLPVEIHLMPKGWYYQSEIALSQAQEQWVLPMVNDSQQTVSPELARESVHAVEKLRANGVNLFARLLLPELGKYAERTAYGQTSVNLARLAIALERYRIAHGNFPDSPDALAPQFLGKIPHDIIGGAPLHYRKTADGQFVLYSIGWNETDDGGVAVFKNGSDPRDEVKADVDMDQGDWVWRYPQNKINR